VAARPLASLLRDLREQQGSSLRAAAKALQVDPSYLSRLERGEKPASDQLLERASRYYDIPFEQFALAKGDLPDDVVEILLGHPELIEKLRSEYGRA
jgi:transcriptional regulator with XRE-family HTH domain